VFFCTDLIQRKSSEVLVRLHANVTYGRVESGKRRRGGLELASRLELFVVRPLRFNHVITRETLVHNSVEEDHENDGSMGLQERNV
jgi:hypothetical protein